MVAKDDIKGEEGLSMEKMCKGIPIYTTRDDSIGLVILISTDSYFALISLKT